MGGRTAGKVASAAPNPESAPSNSGGNTPTSGTDDPDPEDPHSPDGTGGGHTPGTGGGTGGGGGRIDEEAPEEEHVHPEIPPVEDGASAAAIEAYVTALKALDDTHSHETASGKADEHMAAMDLVPRAEATHIAVKSGDWFDPATWYKGQIPGDDAKVLIPEGVHVTYEGISDASLFTVRVDGTLDFATDADSRMVFDTMVVSPKGALVIGTETDPVDPNVTVDLIIANNGPIDTDWDPMLLSRGLISHGETSIFGAVKDSHEKVIDDPMTGDTHVTFGAAPEGWQVGDTIVIAGTHYDGYKWDHGLQKTRLYPAEDEVRIITKIEGNVVHFDKALEHDHDSPRADLKTSVANYTRNVSIETEDAETAEVYERGHVMFMHSDKVDVRYAEFHELGRTDKSEPSFQTDDFQTAAFDNNVQGRYALHLHRTGIDDEENPAKVIGNAVWGSPGWGFVHHDSNAILSNNASFATFGAGYVAETGNETGVWTDNIAIQATGINWGIAKNTSTLSETVFDTARGGDGFWFQGRLIETTDNIAASVNTGFVYFHRDGDHRMMWLKPDQVDHLGVFAYDDVVMPNHAPIRTFDGNETFAAREGLQVVKANPNQGHDVWSELSDFTAWSVKYGAHLEYTSHYILRNFDLIAKEPTLYSPPEDGFAIGKSTSEIVIIDSKVDGFTTGAGLTKTWTFGDYTPDQHDYVLIDTTFTNVGTKFRDFDPALDKVLDRADLPNLKPDLDLDPLVMSGGKVSISGTKSDTLGQVEFPGGSDKFEYSNEAVVNALETEGYWKTSAGKAYFLTDIYFTDRVTGDVYFETHPVFIDDATKAILGKSSWQYSRAVDNGVQDIVTTPEGSTAGGHPLDTPIEVIIGGYNPPEPTPEAAAIWESLTANQPVLDETMPHDHDAMLDEMAA